MSSSEASLLPSHFIDSDHHDVVSFAERAVGDARSDAERASRLFVAVRDGLRYDPYAVSLEREDYRASSIVRQSRAFCVPKAILLTAAARSVGIPARVGFADVRNHLQSAKLRKAMGTDLFVFHGYSELSIDGRWRKATPAFNRELCERFGVAPLSFDGSADALLHEYQADGRRHMEYLRDHGSFDDFPFERMIEAFRRAYGGQKPATDVHDEDFHDPG